MATIQLVEALDGATQAQDAEIAEHSSSTAMDVIGQALTNVLGRVLVRLDKRNMMVVVATVEL